MGGLFAGIEYFTCWQRPQRAVNRVAVFGHALNLLNVQLFVSQLQLWVNALFCSQRGSIGVSQNVQSKRHLWCKVDRRRVKSFLKTEGDKKQHILAFSFSLHAGWPEEDVKTRGHMEENEMSISKVFLCRRQGRKKTAGIPNPKRMFEEVSRFHLLFRCKDSPTFDHQKIYQTYQPLQVYGVAFITNQLTFWQ